MENGKTKLKINNFPTESTELFSNTDDISSSYSNNGLVPSMHPSSPYLNLSQVKTPKKYYYNRSSSVRKRASSLTPSLSSAMVLLQYYESLTEFEHIEVSSYDEVYFLGLGSQKLKGNYSNNEGFYKAVKGDHLAYRYEVVNFIGEGEFGQVFDCIDHKTCKNVAIKIIRNQEKYRKAGESERQILQDLLIIDLDDFSNIVKKEGNFEFRGHLCIVVELLGIDLYRYLEKNNFEGISLPIVRRIAIQMLRALKTIHSLNLIHCDLKPENVMLVSETKLDVKVIDFDSARIEGNPFPEYLQSRYYRAPEIVIEARYGKAIDIWSLGCILTELITGKPLFPGNSESDMFKKYVEVIGPPDLEFMNTGERKRFYIDQNGKVRIMVAPFRRSLEKLLKNVDSAAVNFIENCLKWTPDHRMTADTGLLHPWITGIIT